jgi:catechol 2,3-dioxygenase-like lactoylglutathione lyase family enzyme
LNSRTGGDVSSATPNQKGQAVTAFPPITHVALTVRDLSVSVPWYQDLFDAEPVLDEDTAPNMHHTVFLVSGTLVGLHQHRQPAPPEGFSEYRVGLDHVSFGVTNRVELEKWARRLEELGIEHGGIKDATYGSGVSFRDPDGIALEFFCPPSS